MGGLQEKEKNKEGKARLKREIMVKEKGLRGNLCLLLGRKRVTLWLAELEREHELVMSIWNFQILLIATEV